MEKENGGMSLTNVERLLGASLYSLRKYLDLPNTPDNQRLKDMWREEYQTSLGQLREALNA